MSFRVNESKITNNVIPYSRCDYISKKDIKSHVGKKVSNLQRFKKRAVRISLPNR